MTHLQEQSRLGFDVSVTARVTTELAQILDFGEIGKC
jgi:hypothetical protein